MEAEADETRIFPNRPAATLVVHWLRTAMVARRVNHGLDNAQKKGWWNGLMTKHTGETALRKSKARIGRLGWVLGSCLLATLLLKSGVNFCHID